MATSRFVLFLLIIASTFLASIESQKCKNPLPNLDKTASGIDITKFDFFPISQSNSWDGFVENVFDYTCNGGKWHDEYSNDPIEYDVPDEFVDGDYKRIKNVWTKDPWHGNTYYSIDHNMLEVKRSKVKKIQPFNYHTTEDAQIKRLFSQNKKYQSLLKQYFNSGLIFVQLSKGTKSLHVQPAGRSLSKDFAEFTTQKLPTKYEDNPAIYQQYVQRFGTHFISNGYLGFGHYLQFAIDPQYDKKHRNEQIERNVRVAFYREFNISNVDGVDILESENEDCQVDEDFAKNSEVILSYGAKTSKWVDKVSGKTFTADNSNNGRLLLDIDLENLNTRISNRTIAAQVQIAIRMHTIKAYLGELKNVYNYTNYQLSKEENASLLQVETMLYLNNSRHLDQMDKIVDDLYNKFTNFADKKSCYSTLYDFYITVNLKVEFAKNICAKSRAKIFREARHCVRIEILDEQTEINEMFSSYGNEASQYYFSQDCAQLVEYLKFKYRIKGDRDYGLEAICAKC